MFIAYYFKIFVRKK